jgi:hypothetical protein
MTLAAAIAFVSVAPAYAWPGNNGGGNGGCGNGQQTNGCGGQGGAGGAGGAGGSATAIGVGTGGNGYGGQGGSASSNATNTSTNINQNANSNANRNSNRNANTNINANQNRNSSRSNSSASSGSQSGSSSGGNSQSVSYNSQIPANTSTTVWAAPPVFAPSVVGGNLCAIGASGGVSWMGAGFSIGGTWESRHCEERQKAALLFNIGQREAAVELMCSNKDVYDAMKTAGTPCAPRAEWEPKQAEKPAVVAVTAVAVAPAPYKAPANCHVVPGTTALTCD